MDDDEKLKRTTARYNLEVEDAKRYFGEWDMCDPVVWAIIRVVQAQNDLANAMCEVPDGNAPERMIEDAIAERREAIVALQKAFEREPRGFNP